MPHTKTTQLERKNKPSVRTPLLTLEIDEVVSEPVPKIIKTIDILDIHDDVSGIVEEKPEVDPLLAEEETDESAADEVLDEDEVNPFGDKWEV
jgi:hypothetical protein